MSNGRTVVKTVVSWVQRFWLAAVCVMLLALVVVLGTPAWAAPVPAYHNQTVPRPTPTSGGDPVSTATPRPDDYEDSQADTDAGIAETGGVESSNPLEGLLVQATQAPLTASVAVATLNMREGPGTEFAVVGSVSRGTTLTVLSRNEDGAWWYVCCVPGSATTGWVSAELVEPGFDRAQANDLLPIFGAEVVAAAAQPTANAIAAHLPLMLHISLMPPYVWQGQRAEMILAVTNPNRTAIDNAELSDELPPQLTVADINATAGGKITGQKMPGGKELVLVRWPKIDAGRTVTTTISVTVTQDLADGAVIDNLAAVRAQNGAHTAGAISIGMPPVLLPDFQ